METGSEGAEASQTSPLSGGLDSTHKDSTPRVSHDQTVPVRKRTSMSGSKDEGKEGGMKGGGDGGQSSSKEPMKSDASAKKPSTKAERRALQVLGVFVW